MKVNVFHSRILVALVLVLIGALIPWGRQIEPMAVSTFAQYRWRLCGFAVFALTFAIIFTIRRGLLRPWVAGLVLVIAAILGNTVTTSAEWCHLGVYALLGAALWGAFPARRRWYFLALAGGVIGCCDEWLQSLTPKRVADPWDVALDVVGVLLGLLVLSCVHAPGKPAGPVPFAR